MIQIIIRMVNHRTNTALVAGLMLFLSCATPLLAEERKDVKAGDTDAAVFGSLQKRTTNFCSLVLPAWLSSENGMGDPAVRGVIVDCYMGNARLAVLGVETGLTVEETALTEVPATLLSRETGIDLDIYRPLAGRTLQVKVSKPFKRQTFKAGPNPGPLEVRKEDVQPPLWGSK